MEALAGYGAPRVGDRSGTHHVAHFVDLRPGATYRFRVGSGTETPVWSA